MIREVYNMIVETAVKPSLQRKLLKVIEHRHQMTGWPETETYSIGDFGGKYRYEYHHRTIKPLIMVELPDWIHDGAIIFTSGGDGGSPHRVVFARSDMCWIVPFGQPACDGWAVETAVLIKYWNG